MGKLKLPSLSLDQWFCWLGLMRTEMYQCGCCLDFWTTDTIILHSQRHTPWTDTYRWNSPNQELWDWWASLKQTLRHTILCLSWATRICLEHSFLGAGLFGTEPAKLKAHGGWPVSFLDCQVISYDPILPWAAPSKLLMQNCLSHRSELMLMNIMLMACMLVIPHELFSIN